MDLTGVAVLLVEDDPDARELFAFILETCGATVRAEASARAAVIACDEQTFDVVVSDLSMPNTDGYALLRALKLRPGCVHVPVIALSGFTHHRERALEAGFDLFLAKPVEPSLLCRSVGRVAA